MLDDHGLGVSGIAADLGNMPPTCASLPDYLDVVLRHVEICQILGTNKLRTDTIVPTTEIPGRDGLRDRFLAHGARCSARPPR